MSQIKYTKQELRQQQVKLLQLQRYLPTLQLKKAMLQVETHDARLRIAIAEEKFNQHKLRLDAASLLLQENSEIDSQELAKVIKIDKYYENIAGVEMPQFRGVTFAPVKYRLLETAPWIDSIVAILRNAIEGHIQLEIIREQLAALEKELRDVSIRVNLFEKILIPRTLSDIKKVKVFLSDQQLAAVARAKVAKKKIIARSEFEASLDQTLKGRYAY